MKEIMFWLHRFVMAYGIIMLGIFFMCLLFNPTSQLPVVSFFWQVYHSHPGLHGNPDRLLFQKGSDAGGLVVSYPAACNFARGPFAASCPPLAVLVRADGCRDLCFVYFSSKDSLASGRLRPEHTNGSTGQSTASQTPAKRTTQRITGEMGSTGGSQLQVHHMKPSRKTNWIRCPECGGKTRTQVREHTLLEDFPLFCPKCHCEW